MMTGYRLLEGSLLIVLSFLFYLVRYKEEKTESFGSYNYNRMIRSWSPVIGLFILAIIAFLLWLAE